MGRRNRRKKTGEASVRLGVPCLGPSRSRSDPDPIPRKRVSFAGIDNGSPLNVSPVARAERSGVPKTSEYAFFKKLKSDASVRHGSKLSDNVGKNTKLFDSGIKTRGIDCPVKDRHMNPSFETAGPGFHGSHVSSVKVTPKESEKDMRQSSAAFGVMCGRDENMKPLVNSTGPVAVNDQRGDIFSLKRQKLRQWVRDITFLDIRERTSSGDDLVSILLGRLFPGTEEKQASKIPNEEWMDRLAKAKSLESPQSDFLNRFDEAFMGVQHRLHMENSRPIYWLSSPGERIIPSLQFPSTHVLSNFIPRDTEEIRLEPRGKAAVSYSKVDSVSSPPFLKHRAILLDEDSEDCYSQDKSSYPISSPQFINYEPLSLSYHKERVGYSSESSFLEKKEPALLLEWDDASWRNMDDLSLGHHAKLITYLSPPSSSVNDYLWSCSYTSHDSDIEELYGKHEPRRHIIQDIDPVSDLNQHTWYDMNSIRDLTRNSNYTSTHKDNSLFYHHLSSSLFFNKQSWKWFPLDSSPGEHHSSTYETIEVPRDEETMSLSLFSTSNVNLLEAPIHMRTHHFDSLDCPSSCFWSPKSWTSS